MYVRWFFPPPYPRSSSVFSRRINYTYIILAATSISVPFSSCAATANEERVLKTCMYVYRLHDHDDPPFVPSPMTVAAIKTADVVKS